MKILFVMRHAGFVRNYESVLRALAAAGHRVHLAIELIERNKHGEVGFGGRLMQESSAITMGPAEVPEDTHWSRALSTSRLLVDFLRYLDPRFAGATALRARAGWVVPPTFQPLVRLFNRLGSGPAALAAALLTRLEHAAPLSRKITTFLETQRPDLVMVTPLVEPGSIQVDYIKSARRLGIPSALGVASWDNLTNKGSLRVIPDRVFVWNPPQQDEAVTLHGVPADRVTVTGAQIFDHWFDWQPSRTREQFCRTVGLDPAQPYVLYLGSSFFIAPDEAEFGARWVAAIRSSADPVVASAGILIRPHPSSGRQWRGLDLSAWRETAIWPPSGVDMTAPDFKFDFFDSLYYSALVVGVNTSAQIEAAIVGKGVCTVQDADFGHSQAGTLHFQHLVDGGLLQVARTLDEHVGHVGAILRDPAAQAERSRRFVEYFVRPFGRDVAATPRLGDAMVALASSRPVPVRESPAARFARPLLTPLAVLVAWLPERRHWWVYVMRPPLWAAMHLWLVPYRVRSAWAAVVAALRKARYLARIYGEELVLLVRRRIPRWTRRGREQLTRSGRLAIKDSGRAWKATMRRGTGVMSSKVTKRRLKTVRNSWSLPWRIARRLVRASGLSKGVR